jgi:ribonuclease P protein component
VPDFSFSKRLRLLSPSDFERVFAAKQSATDRLITMYGLRNECGHPRLGLVVSRRIGNAVERNRWKRLLREVFRLEQHGLPPLDLICIPRAGSEPELEPLRQSILRLAGKLAHRSEAGGGSK